MRERFAFLGKCRGRSTVLSGSYTRETAKLEEDLNGLVFSRLALTEEEQLWYALPRTRQTDTSSTTGWMYFDTYVGTKPDPCVVRELY